MVYIGYVLLPNELLLSPFPLVLFSFLRSMLLDNKFYSHYTNSNNSNTNDLIFFFGKLFPNFSIQDKNQLIEKKMIIYNTEFEFLFFYE